MRARTFSNVAVANRIRLMICEQCKAPFQPRDARHLYCSSPCSKKAERLRRKARGLDGKVAGKQCVVCGAYGVRPDSLTCSRACRYGHSKSQELETVGKRGKRQAPLLVINITIGSRIFVQGNCHECGKGFAAKALRGDEKYCSTDCMNKAARRNGKHVRRSKIKTNRTSNVSRAQVFARDNNICQACNKPVDFNDYKTKIGRDGRPAFIAGDLFPTIDHIHPLSKGGSHGMGNLQTMHLLCNSHKNDQVLTEVTPMPAYPL